jgi:hypothetical protein
MHALAVGFSHKYLTENADAVRMNWPRIPLPDSKSALIRSSELGRQIAAALDANGHVEGLCAGKIRPELSVIGSISRETGGSLNPDSGDLDVTAGWGHRGNGGAVMPGKGRVIARDYMPTEREAIAAGAAALGLAEEQVVKLLGESTLDVYLNNFGYWKNIPIRVWKYTIGGYQVIKKWLSYREREILGRGLKMDEVRAVTDIARRVAAILLMEPELDRNYDAVRKATYAWTDRFNWRGRGKPREMIQSAMRARPAAVRV